jgi:hypothetical protein
MCSVGNRSSTFCEKPLAVILSLWLTACKYDIEHIPSLWYEQSIVI